MVQEGQVWGKAEEVWEKPEEWERAEEWAKAEEWRGRGAPAVTVRLAEMVVSKNAVMVTDVLFPTANVVTVKLAEVWPPGNTDYAWHLGNGELLVASVTEMPPAGAGALKNTVPVAFVPPRTLVGANRHRLQQRRRIWIWTYVDENRPGHAARCCEHISACRETCHCAGCNGEAGCAVSCRDGNCGWHMDDRGIISR